MRLTRPLSLRTAIGAIAAAAFAAPLTAQAPAASPADTLNDPVRILVSRLDLEKYKANVKGLTQFGDRRQGTERNRKAVDWIEAQLKSYGCTNTQRITYDYQPPPPRARRSPEEIARLRARFAASPRGAGGSHIRGNRAHTGVNTDSLAQPDAKLRALDTPPSVAGERQEVYCTKVGTTHPDEMYIVGGHMDGIGWGEAANDDGSGTALVMEVARVFSSSDVQTDRSVRFILWNNEETGLNGSRAYVAQRAALQ
ncbi:MAG: M28 family peptidase, partial [Gemmatimonadaceae bacterium]